MAEFGGSLRAARSWLWHILDTNKPKQPKPKPEPQPLNYSLKALQTSVFTWGPGSLIVTTASPWCDQDQHAQTAGFAFYYSDSLQAICIDTLCTTYWNSEQTNTRPTTWVVNPTSRKPPPSLMPNPLRSWLYAMAWSLPSSYCGGSAYGQ